MFVYYSRVQVLSNLLNMINIKPNKLESSDDLLNLVELLHQGNPITPITLSYDQKIIDKFGEYQSKRAHISQGEHWISWLGGYDGAGFYNRKNSSRTPRFIYNHINCPQMLIWLAEVVGISSDKINMAMIESLKVKKFQTQCAIIRRIIPWNQIENKWTSHKTN